MKSSFLSLSILGLLLSFNVGAQPTKKKAVKNNGKPQVQVEKPAAEAKAEVAPAQTLEEKTATQKFYDRLSIGYFGVFTSPNLEDRDIKRGALSPEFSGGTNQDSYAMSLWNQVNFGYGWGGKFKFNVIPRFTIFLAEAPDQSPGERGAVILEDLLVGFSGVLFSSQDKKFNWWLRPGVRLPTSHASRTFNHADFGQLSHQIEHLHVFTYDFNPIWQLGFVIMDRYWIFEDRYNRSRHRIYSSPYVSYTVNDTTKVQLYYENMLENNKRWKSIDGRSPLYQDVWQNMFIGVAKDVTKKLNVMPFVSAYVNDVPFSTQSFWAGAWISYSIK